MEHGNLAAVRLELSCGHSRYLPDVDARVVGTTLGCVVCGQESRVDAVVHETHQQFAHQRG